jgi:hypothetical protein
MYPEPVVVLVLLVPLEVPLVPFVVFVMTGVVQTPHLDPEVLQVYVYPETE